MRPGLTSVAVAVLLGGLACTRGLTREYEYEQEVFLDLDGSATMIINSSVAALVAIHGLDLDPNPRSRFDRRAIEAAFTSTVTRVTRISRPWLRHGRRFVQARIEIADVRRLAEARPFASVTCQFDRAGDEYTFRETPGPPAGPPSSDVAGGELIAIRVHVPSRIRYHNVRRLDNAQPGTVGRGNILTWEQTLADRLRGVPLDIEVRMDARSILGGTLRLFAGATLLALAVVAGLIWWTSRRGLDA